MLPIYETLPCLGDTGSTRPQVNAATNKQVTSPLPFDNEFIPVQTDILLDKGVNGGLIIDA